MSRGRSGEAPPLPEPLPAPVVDNHTHLDIVLETVDSTAAAELDKAASVGVDRIVQVGTAEEILTDPANDYVAQFVQDVDRTRVLTARSVMEKPVSIVSSSAHEQEAFLRGVPVSVRAWLLDAAERDGLAHVPAYATGLRRLRLVSARLDRAAATA